VNYNDDKFISFMLGQSIARPNHNTVKTQLPYEKTAKREFINGEQASTVPIKELYERARSILDNYDGCNCTTCRDERTQFVSWLQAKYEESLKCKHEEERERPWAQSYGHNPCTLFWSGGFR